MDYDVNKRVKNTVLEGLGQRKTMFVPMVCISSFMLVGYAALDKEAPEIITTSVTMDLSKAQSDGIDYGKIEAVDNRDDSSAIKFLSNVDLVDFDRPGEYTIYVTATDSFNNKSDPQQITLNLVDNDAPELTVNKDAEDGSYKYEDGVINLRYNSNGDLKNYVTAVDNDKSSGYNGNLTEWIYQEDAYGNRIIDTSAVGTQFASIRVEDNSGNATEKTYPIYIFDDVEPILQKTDLGNGGFINYGSEFNIADYITAHDELDGDLTTEMVVTGDTVDTTIFGATYQLSVTVTDHSGNKATDTLTLTVADIEAPKITFSKNNFTVSLYDTINVSDYVSVSDNYDQNVASKVEYTGAIDTATTGDKSVTITVADESGNVAVETFNVTVIDPVVYSRNQIVSLAQSKVGCAYVYGGTGPNSFDCSGFTQWLYAQVGISIPRTASTQYASGTYVSYSDLQPGDLLFFDTFGGASHVGVYIGDGMMVHAGTSATGVNYSNINSSYWSSCYLGARRY